MRKLFVILFSLVLLILSGSSAYSGSSPVCKYIDDRGNFESAVWARMYLYSNTGDSWSPRAKKWLIEIRKNIDSGKPTVQLNGVYNRVSEYCLVEKDEFMAGLMIGEWIGIALYKD